MTPLRQLRIRAGYSTADAFAKEMGVKAGTYTPYEREGKRPPINLGLKIADILGCSLDQLYGRAPLVEYLGDEEAALVKIYNNLGVDNKTRLRMYLDFLGYLEEKQHGTIG